MGLDYALVHAKYTVPPAVALTLLYRPLFSKRDVYRISFLITIAVIATIPWDSYLIRTRIWSYPEHAVFGKTIFQIPLEELFFFFIQTYITSLIYIIYSKADFFPAYLQKAVQPGDNKDGTLSKSLLGTFGQIAVFLCIVQGWQLVQAGGKGTYFGLIAIWAFPFLLFLWSISNAFMLRIPLSKVIVPIALPTFYLWMVDTFSLQRGTWVIEEGTKFGIHLWNGLEIEEAFFFLATNTLIVFGQVAFDNAVTLIDAFPATFPGNCESPSPLTAMRAFLMSTSKYEDERPMAFADAMKRLQKKSRSFYLASAMFEGRLRIDLILLYSFCRVADDLIDEAKDVHTARTRIRHLRTYLDLAYSSQPGNVNNSKALQFVETTFPDETRHTLLHLPVAYLSRQPLYDLLKGFEMDLNFSDSKKNRVWPIGNDSSLEQYGKYVAGTVAELCCELVFHHNGRNTPQTERARTKAAAVEMGVALQTVNIARDIAVDAALGRVYIPTEWLEEQRITPQDILRNPAHPKVLKLRSRLLAKAFAIYSKSKPALEELPSAARGPMRVAIESYMEIGRVLQHEDYTVKAGRATVPTWRRIWVAWKALNK